MLSALRKPSQIRKLKPIKELLVFLETFSVTRTAANAGTAGTIRTKLGIAVIPALTEDAVIITTILEDLIITQDILTEVKSFEYRYTSQFVINWSPSANCESLNRGATFYR